MTREVRLQPMPDKLIGGAWTYKFRRIVRLGDVGRWALVRNADYPQAVPFAISLKDWDKLEVEQSA